MRFFKNVLAQLHTFVLWGLASFILWGWIFALVTNTSPEKKVTVYCYVPGVRDVDLAVRLEEEPPEGIRMVKVHPFSYVMLNVDYMEDGDIFILPESQIGEYTELLADPAAGVLVYDAETGQGAAVPYIDYTEEDYYLFLGANSPHLADGKAAEVARRLMDLS